MPRGNHFGDDVGIRCGSTHRCCQSTHTRIITERDGLIRSRRGGAKVVDFQDSMAANVCKMKILCQVAWNTRNRAIVLADQQVLQVEHVTATAHRCQFEVRDHVSCGRCCRTLITQEPDESISASAPRHHVISSSSSDRVIPFLAKDDVIASTAIDRIVTAGSPTFELNGRIGTGQILNDVITDLRLSHVKLLEYQIASSCRRCQTVRSSQSIRIDSITKNDVVARTPIDYIVTSSHLDYLGAS